MRERVEIENIEEMRRSVGIDDVELREAVDGLTAGDLVRLTVLRGARPGVAVLVRITSVKGSAFRGKVARGPAGDQGTLRVGSLLAFTAAHIHSIPNRADLD
jgi:hypothetical protein